MFSNLATYLLGYGEPVATAAAAAADSPKGENENLRLTTVETDDDDWLMVETCNEETEQRSRSSSTGSNPAHSSNMEESWFVTPPPCFTSTEAVTVETSPLENLLIEHPSMSVYHHRGANHLSASSSPSSASSLSPTPTRCRSLSPTTTTTSVVAESDVPSSPTPATTAHSPDRRRRRQPTGDGDSSAVRTTTNASNDPTNTPRRAPLRPTNILNQQASLLAQKHQNQKEFQAVKNKQLERNNKVRDVNKRNKRQRRADRQKNHSGANNNRKCC